MSACYTQGAVKSFFLSPTLLFLFCYIPINAVVTRNLVTGSFSAQFNILTRRVIRSLGYIEQFHSRHVSIQMGRNPEVGNDQDETYLPNALQYSRF